MKKTPLERALPWAVVVGLFALWELLCWAFAVPDFLLPAA